MAYNKEKKSEIVTSVCARIINGEAMREILKDEDLPHFSTFLLWVSQDLAKSEQYAQAMHVRSELLFEETLDIADNGSNDWMENKDPNNAGYKFNGEHFQRSRLRVDTRKWYLSKLNPKKFGDRVQNDITIKEQPLFPE
jgi:hypothetical protein